MPTTRIRHFRLDPRFRYLDQALRTPDAARTEWQRRILAGLRTYVTANSGHRPAMRIILAATALEALIGNDFAPGTGATGGHQLARRAAFVWCGAEFGDRHGSQRPICPFLAELNGKRLDQKLRDEAARGVPWTCSYYADLRDLYDDRNAALHGAEVRFTDQLAARHEFTIEQVLFEVLEWVTTSGAKRFAQYEGAIGALPER